MASITSVCKKSQKSCRCICLGLVQQLPGILPGLPNSFLGEGEISQPRNPQGQNLCVWQAVFPSLKVRLRMGCSQDRKVGGSGDI